MPNKEIFCQTEYLLSIAITKCGNLEDAQDITQDTMLSALAYVKRGGTIENPQAFLSTLLNRKYYDMLRRKYKLPTVTIGENFDIADDSNIEETLISNEEAENIRREVAYLSESYRSVIVRHYFHGKTVKEIGDELNLPIGTVKSRLDFGRKQIKKGFEEMEKYNENSYMPQYLAVRNSGSSGLNGEPMSLTEDDVLAQNLLILAYEKPVSVSELSKAIGVATAYVEPIVNKLVDGELMKRMCDGKVFTDFIIYHATDYVKYIHEAESFAEEHIDAYINPLKNAIEELKHTSFYSRRLERFMMIHIADAGLYNCMTSVRKPQIFPDRPNGGKWIAFATIFPQNYTIPKEKCGKEEYLISGMRWTSLDRYLNSYKLRIYNYETTLDANHCAKGNNYTFKTHDELETNVLKLFYVIKNKLDYSLVDLDIRIIEGIPALEHCGFLTTQNGTPELLVPVLTHEEEKRFFEICDKAQKIFGDAIRDDLIKYCNTHKKEIPSHLKSVPDQKLTMPFEPKAMMFVYEAINRGIHPRDLGYNCPETFVVFD